MSLPTLDKLGSKVPQLSQEQIHNVAASWIQSFQELCESNPTQLGELFLPNNEHPPFWRDILALTWNFRTFAGHDAISKFLHDRELVLRQISNCKPLEKHVELQQVWADVVWIQAIFVFSTDQAHCMAVVRLVPLPDNSWKAYTLFTKMQDLKGYPEMIGSNRNSLLTHGYWARQRAEEHSFEETPPEVIIVGSGHSGLSLAARLTFLGIKVLVVEKNARVGDNWRNRYESLCLHDSVWMDHMPYLLFPPTWPVFAPAEKLADWLESYARILDLPVWVSSNVTSARPSKDGQKGWDVNIQCQGDTVREFKNVPHLVLATGMGGGKWNFPAIPGMDTFTGKIMHSMQYKNALEHKDKRVYVIGSATSAHDIAADHCAHGIDVTIFQRSPIYVMTSAAMTAMSVAGVYGENGPPLEVADCLSASFPNLLMTGEFAQRMTATLAKTDKEILDGLDRVGFQRNLGINDTGLILLAWNRAGGYYIDTGASQMIADGKIKIKNGTNISRITEKGISFEDGTEAEADVIIFATGLGDSRETVREICGDDVASRCTPIWGLDEEGEVNGCWKEFGVPGLWYMCGGLGHCRFHSKNVALQIKAMQTGIYGSRYTRPEHV